VGLTILQRKKNKLATKCSEEPWTWTDSLDKRTKRQNIDMRFGTWRKIIMFLGGKMRPVRRADKLSAICEPTV
jgi:hypothetical protein